MIDSTAKPIARKEAPQEAPRLDLDLISDALRGIRFGSVEIVLQDARIVQIQRLEKHRLV